LLQKTYYKQDSDIRTCIGLGINFCFNSESNITLLTYFYRFSTLPFDKKTFHFVAYVTRHRHPCARTLHYVFCFAQRTVEFLFVFRKFS